MRMTRAAPKPKANFSHRTLAASVALASLGGIAAACSSTPASPGATPGTDSDAATGADATGATPDGGSSPDSRPDASSSVSPDGGALDESPSGSDSASRVSAVDSGQPPDGGTPGSRWTGTETCSGSGVDPTTGTQSTFAATTTATALSFAQSHTTSGATATLTGVTIGPINGWSCLTQTFQVASGPGGVYMENGTLTQIILTGQPMAWTCTMPSGSQSGPLAIEVVEVTYQPVTGYTAATVPTLVVQVDVTTGIPVPDAGFTELLDAGPVYAYQCTFQLNPG
jgi:hypothetical protein